MYKNQYFNIFNLLENDGKLINRIVFEIQNVYKNERINSKLEV